MDNKQTQKKSLKDKIKMLMNKNKQIDDVMDVSPSQQKQHLQQQKDDNNDELRKIRSQKYELEQIQENIDYIIPNEMATFFQFTPICFVEAVTSLLFKISFFLISNSSWVKIPFSFNSFNFSNCSKSIFKLPLILL